MSNQKIIEIPDALKQVNAMEFKYLLKVYGISIAKISKEMGITQRNLYYYETRPFIPIKFVRALVNLVSVDVALLEENLIAYRNFIKENEKKYKELNLNE